MDPTIAQYATLAANLGLAGFMAIMLLTWNKEANAKADKDRKEREKAAERDAEKCKACMEAHQKDYQAMLERVLEQGQESARFMEAVANGLNAQRRLDQMERMLGEVRHGSSNTR